jgi:hypothetical protein
LQAYYQLVHASGWRVWADEFRTFGASQPQDILKGRLLNVGFRLLNLVNLNVSLKLRNRNVHVGDSFKVQHPFHFHTYRYVVFMVFVLL